MSLTKVTYSMIESGPINVVDFGATGDGVTDDTAAIRLAWTKAKATSKNLYFPSGTYMVTNLESIITDSGDMGGMVVFGDGRNLSKIQRIYAYRSDFTPSQIAQFGAYSASGAIFDFTGGAKNITFSDLGFIGYNSGPTDPNLPSGYTQHYSYYNSSGTAILIYQSGATVDTIENITFQNIYGYKGYTPIYVDDVNVTAKNIFVSNIVRQGGYYGMNILGATNVVVNNIFIESLEGVDGTWEILRAFYMSSSDVTINNFIAKGIHSVGIFVRAFAPYAIKNVNIENVNIEVFANGIDIQCKTDTSIRSVNVNNATIKTTGQNPAGGISLITDGSAPVNRIIENININNLATSGVGRGIYLASEAVGTSAVMDGINITNVTAEAALNSVWFTNGSSEHSTPPTLVKNFAMRNVSVITNPGSAYGTIRISNFVDSAFENITTNSTAAFVIFNNKRVRITATTNTGYQPNTSSSNYPLLFNGLIIAQEKTLYANSAATTVESVVGASAGTPMSADDFYDWLKFLTKYQNNNLSHFANLITFSNTGTFTFPVDADSYSGITISGGTYTLNYTNNLSTVVFTGCTFTGTQDIDDSVNLTFDACTFNTSGSTAINLRYGSLSIANCAFTATTAIYASGPGTFVWASGSTGTSTTAYRAEQSATIEYKGTDTLTGATVQNNGGTVSTF